MYRIEEVTLFNENSKHVAEKCANINVLVGANNSGKTTFLYNLYNDTRSLILYGSSRGPFWICGIKLVFEKDKKSMEKLFPGLSKAKKFCNLEDIAGSIHFTHSGTDRKNIPWNDVVYDILKSGTKKHELKVEFMGSNDRKEWHLMTFLNTFMIDIETCEHRLGAALHVNIQNILSTNDNSFLKHVFKNRNVLTLIQKEIKSVYNLDLSFDNIQQGDKHLRIINERVNSRIIDQKKLAIEWANKTTLTSNAGHGLKAYLKIIFTLLNPSNSIVLIDEPETFIHPPQRRSLGRLIARLASKYKKQIFLATHDSELIRGLLSDRAEVKLFKLNVGKPTNTYKTFDSSDIQSMIKKRASNLLNERILNSLFYHKTVLCENENDRMFYEEAAALYKWERLQNVNFIGLGGHGEVVKIWEKLKTLGIKTAVIVDFDFLKDRELPDSISDPTLKQEYDRVKALLKTVSKVDKVALKSGGLNYILKSALKTHHSLISSLIKNLGAHEFFIVPIGEMESWTKILKNDLPLALERIRKKRNPLLNAFLTRVLS